MYKLFKISILSLLIIFISTSVVFAASAQCAPGNGDIPAVERKASSHGIIPQSLIDNISVLNKFADYKLSSFLVLGHAVMCYATHFGAHSFTILGVNIKFFPHIGLLLSGMIFWVLGIFLVLIVGYYLIDISFKLAFAVLAMPIGIALWPFPVTKSYLGKIVGIMFYCAGIFIFLSLGITLAMVLFNAAAGSSGFDELYDKLNSPGEEDAKFVADNLSLFSTRFLLLVFAGIYGFRLIGQSVNEYTKKFFPSSVEMGSPMHSRATQMTSLVTQKGLGFAKDVLRTQAGRGLNAIGGKIGSGIEKLGEKQKQKGHKVLGAILGTVGRAGRQRAENHEKAYQSQGKGEGAKKSAAATANKD